MARQRAIAFGLGAVLCGLAMVALAGGRGSPGLLLQQARPVLVDVFPPTPAWGTTPSSVGQVGNGDTPNKGQEINVLGGSYQFPDYARQGQRQQSALVMTFGQPVALAWETTPNSIGAVGSGEEAAPGQDINVLGGDYVFPSYATAPVRRSIQIPTAARLWGGEYSSVGKFPAGFNGQVREKLICRCCFVDAVRLRSRAHY